MSKQLQLTENKIQGVKGPCNSAERQKTISDSLVENGTELEGMHLKLYQHSMIEMHGLNVPVKPRHSGGSQGY